MPREHRYRGRRVDNGEWIKGSLIIDDVSGKYYISLSVEESQLIGQEGCLRCVTCEVDPETVGEYTTRNDDNGVEIYEGDICRCLDMNDEYYVSDVRFNGGAIAIDVYGEYDFTAIGWALEHYIQEIEVIGNVYDQPELLEV